MTEKKMQQAVINFLMSHGIYYLKTIVCSRAGVPDIIACVNGWLLALEIKGTGGKESELQKYNGEKIRQSGGKYFVVTPENYISVTESILKEMK